MWGALVGCVSFAAGPYFIEQKIAGDVGGAVQVVEDAAVFFAGGADEGGQFGLEKGLLAGLGVHHDDEGDSVFGELGRSFRASVGAWRFSFCLYRATSRLALFASGHGAGLYSNGGKKRK